MQAVALELLRKGELHRHPAVLWTAVALLRSDHPSIYDRYACIITSRYWLVVTTELTAFGVVTTAGHCCCLTASKATHLFDDSFSRSAVTVVELTRDEMDTLSIESVGDVRASDAQSDRRLPEDFMTYAEKWTPQFEGIQHLSAARIVESRQRRPHPLIAVFVNAGCVGQHGGFTTHSTFGYRLGLPASYLPHHDWGTRAGESPHRYPP